MRLALAFSGHAQRYSQSPASPCCRLCSFKWAPRSKVKANRATKAATKQTSIPPGDWPLYSRDLASDRFSPLTQINTTNVAQLTQAWTYRPPAPPPPPDNGKGGGGKGKGKGGPPGLVAESTPIVVNGVMYVAGGNRVFALDADNGKESWSYTAPGAVANRSLGYWPGDGNNPPRILFTTGTKMMALNANTGTVDPGFGKEGTVEIGISWGGAPYVYKNLIIVGNNNGEANDGPPGDTKTYDARTGRNSGNSSRSPSPAIRITRKPGSTTAGRIAPA